MNTAAGLRGIVLIVGKLAEGSSANNMSFGLFNRSNWRACKVDFGLAITLLI
jgi:hypothetical protein